MMNIKSESCQQCLWKNVKNDVWKYNLIEFVHKEGLLHGGKVSMTLQ